MTPYDISVQSLRTLAVPLITTGLFYGSAKVISGGASRLFSPLLSLLSTNEMVSSAAEYIGVACIRTGSLFFFTAGLINSFWMFQDIKRDWELKKQIAKRPFTQEVTLIAVAKADWGGAITRIKQPVADAIKELLKTTSVVWDRVGSIDDIGEALNRIKAQGRRISTLWLRQHADAETVELSWTKNGFKIPGSDFHKLDLSTLTESATIIVEGCSAAKPLQDKRNIAEWIQVAAGQKRTVYAPTGVTVRISYAPHNDHPAWCFFNRAGQDITKKISYDEAILKN